ncbi:hypothetical protein BaRGS_00035640, partial [Batillaria attramentaria]
ETSSVPVTFHPFLSLTTDDITRCFDADSNLPVAAAAGEISYSTVNKTFAYKKVCRLTLTAPEEQVVFFKMAFCSGALVLRLYDAASPHRYGRILQTLGGKFQKEIYSYSNVVVVTLEVLSHFDAALRLMFSAVQASERPR